MTVIKRTNGTISVSVILLWQVDEENILEREILILEWKFEKVTVWPVYKNKNLLIDCQIYIFELESDSRERGGRYIILSSVSNVDER